MTFDTVSNYTYGRGALSKIKIQLSHYSVTMLENVVQGGLRTAQQHR
jgi:hypothetical protein